MENREYIFTKTSSGDRTNIMTGFPIWDKELFFTDIRKKLSSDRYRYGKIGGRMSLLKDMRLEEFNEVFKPSDFTSKQVTYLFRKEISEQYGEHAIKAKIKPLRKKDLERGGVYEDFSGRKWVYYGEVEQEIDRTPYQRYSSDKKPIEINNGHGFQAYYGSFKPRADISLLKSIKRLLKKVDIPLFELNGKYTYDSGRMSWIGYERKITLKLL